LKVLSDLSEESRRAPRRAARQDATARRLEPAQFVAGCGLFATLFSTPTGFRSAAQNRAAPSIIERATKSAELLFFCTIQGHSDPFYWQKNKLLLRLQGAA
jgi:hypothetical protein